MLRADINRSCRDPDPATVSANSRARQCRCQNKDPADCRPGPSLQQTFFGSYHRAWSGTALANSTTNDDTANNGDANEDDSNRRIQMDPSNNRMDSSNPGRSNSQGHSNSPDHSRQEREFRC